MQNVLRLAVATLVVVVLGVASSGCGRRAGATAPRPAAIEAVNLGVSLMGQYDYAGAVEAFDRALAAEPGNPEIQVNLAIARFNRGKKEDQDIEQATALLDAVLTVHPDHARALYCKAILLQHIGQAEAAVPLLERVVGLRPEDGVAWYILGLCKQRAGQDPEQELRRAIELHPYLASGYYRLWQTLQAAGQAERAAPYLERFKQLREHPLAETIELPQYNQMGDLALVVPLAGVPKTTPARYQAGPSQDLVARAGPTAPADASPPQFGGAALLPVQGSDAVDIVPVGWPGDSDGRGAHLRYSPSHVQSVASALAATAAPAAAAIGDYDNDEVPDVLLVLREGVELLHGSADGTFARATDILTPAPSGRTRSALWVDADHDGDLDLFLCNAGRPDQLFNNNGDGTFTGIAEKAGLAKPEGDSVMVLPGDIDGDRDMDLVVLREGAPARLFLNELSGTYREAPMTAPVRGDLGGVLQDFTGDGYLDLLVLSDHPALPALYVGDGHGGLTASPGFAQTAMAAATFGIIRGLRVADLELDGDLDVALFGEEGHMLTNDGVGNFTAQARVWQPTSGAKFVGAEVADVTGDLVPDVILLEQGSTDRIRLVPGQVDPKPAALAVAPTGVRSRDKRTRSPASGYGATVSVRAGLREQTRWNTGQHGGFVQAPLPLLFGLGGVSRVDYVRVRWPDGVAQVETAMPAGRTVAIAETQRKISSCPVLFTWNGNEFEFITDFAGVGGLGYYLAPGEYAPAQPVDHVKIEPDQLRPRDGKYELRITEAMEESAYVDHLELLAIDHPADWVVYPDERLAVTGPAPTHELLAVDHPVHALHATGPDGSECADALRRADRRYAYTPRLDRRFLGFCQPHVLELDFGGQLAGIAAADRVFLFINGYLEYPYSQTAYAANQAGVGWQPIRIERQDADGTWRTIVPDAGALGGMARTMTVDLSGLLSGGARRLRLISNLEIYYDEVFLGAPTTADRVRVHSLEVATADLGYLGFARETSPDGRDPLTYDYSQVASEAPFHVLRGAYTRYGPVRELLTSADDSFVLMAPGDEIAATFDAAKLPPLEPGMVRSFVLISHAYCKDMDLYTATPQTLEPMPFRGMTRYPYPPTEKPAETDQQRRLREIHNSRIVE